LRDMRYREIFRYFYIWFLRRISFV
jgi:hypothetical protein